MEEIIKQDYHEDKLNSLRQSILLSQAIGLLSSVGDNNNIGEP